MQYFTFNVYFLYLGQCRRQDALWPDSWTDSWTRKEAGLRLQRTLDQKTRVRRHFSLGQAKFSLLFCFFLFGWCPMPPTLWLAYHHNNNVKVAKWQTMRKMHKIYSQLARAMAKQICICYCICICIIGPCFLLFFLRISRFRCCTDRRSKVEPKKPNTITMLATCGGRSRFSCAGQWIGRSASGYHGHPQWVNGHPDTLWHS